MCILCIYIYIYINIKLIFINVCISNFDIIKMRTDFKYSKIIYKLLN